MPATVSWVLAEDTRLLGQRQRTFLWHSKQHEFYDHVGLPAPQVPQRRPRVIQVDAVHALRFNHCRGKLSLGTPAFWDELQAHRKPVLQRETISHSPGQ